MFSTSTAAKAYIYAGNAVLTATSRKTGKSYTYRVRRRTAQPNAGGGAEYFVSVLTGPDNSMNYQYLGFLGRHRITRKLELVGGHKGNPSHPAFKAFSWIMGQLSAGDEIPEDLELRHEGRCGKCGRKLTTPDSIDLGLGPVCREGM